MKTNDGILMVEPFGSAATVPILDELTCKMTAAWRKRRSSGDEYFYKGVHYCVCGAKSDNEDHWVGRGNGLLTNSLCVHYLAFHRDDVSKDELDKVRALDLGEEEPNTDELASPHH